MTKTNRLFNDLGVDPPYRQKIEGDHISSVIIAPKNSINYPKTPINNQKVLKTTDIQCNIDILENEKQFIPKIQKTTSFNIKDHDFKNINEPKKHINGSNGIKEHDFEIIDELKENITVSNGIKDHDFKNINEPKKYITVSNGIKDHNFNNIDEPSQKMESSSRFKDRISEIDEEYMWKKLFEHRVKKLFVLWREKSKILRLKGLSIKTKKITTVKKQIFVLWKTYIVNKLEKLKSIENVCRSKQIDLKHKIIIIEKKKSHMYLNNSFGRWYNLYHKKHSQVPHRVPIFDDKVLTMNHINVPPIKPDPKYIDLINRSKESKEKKILQVMKDIEIQKVIETQKEEEKFRNNRVQREKHRQQLAESIEQRKNDQKLAKIRAEKIKRNQENNFKADLFYQKHCDSFKHKILYLWKGLIVMYKQKENILTSKHQYYITKEVFYSILKQFNHIEEKKNRIADKNYFRHLFKNTIKILHENVLHEELELKNRAERIYMKRLFIIWKRRKVEKKRFKKIRATIQYNHFLVYRSLKALINERERKETSKRNKRKKNLYEKAISYFNEGLKEEVIQDQEYSYSDVF